MLHLAVVLFLASPPAAEPAYFRLELAPSGSQVSIGEPVVKGGMLVFHAYPDGKLMSLRRSDVKSATKITAKEAAGPAATDPKPIANLAMQGGTVPAGTPGSGKAATASSGPALTRPIVQAGVAAAAAQGPSVVATTEGLAVVAPQPVPPPPAPKQ
ncbi:MAG TPA: hypothetical protein VKG23_05840 [Thermoanaerobaculia bacterium]|nr:hypothetical protein [Thermoanaerobaculia bacterium]